MRLKDVAELQRGYENLVRYRDLTKKNLCDLVIPFRDKYGLTDMQALAIARNECSLSYIDNLLPNPPTNAARIRSMSDKELAKVLNAFCKATDNCLLCPLYEECHSRRLRSEGSVLQNDDFENWLKQEVQE